MNGRGLIRSFDGLVRRVLGVVEFNRDPECLLRIRKARLKGATQIGEVRLPPGSPYIEIHLWNEHLPVMPSSGPDVAWAARSARLFIHSMRMLAAHIGQDPELAACRAIGGTAVLADDPSSIALLRRLGFTVTEATIVLGSIGAFWKNAYSRALIRTFNPPSASGGRPLRRSEIWMTTETFLARYGSGPERGERREVESRFSPAGGPHA